MTLIVRQRNLREIAQARRDDSTEIMFRNPYWCWKDRASSRLARASG